MLNLACTTFTGLPSHKLIIPIYYLSYCKLFISVYQYKNPINPLTPELNPSAQRCLTRLFTGDFAS
jgi:hypothetical protein